MSKLCVVCDEIQSCCGAGWILRSFCVCLERESVHIDCVTDCTSSDTFSSPVLILTVEESRENVNGSVIGGGRRGNEEEMDRH